MCILNAYTISSLEELDRIVPITINGLVFVTDICAMIIVDDLDKLNQFYGYHTLDENSRDRINYYMKSKYDIDDFMDKEGNIQYQKEE